MIHPTHLRVLRSSLRVHPPNPTPTLPLRLIPGLSPIRRHSPRCLPLCAPPRAFSITSSLLSSSADASSPKPTITTTTTTTTSAHDTEPLRPSSSLSPTAANPPATTRPPPLDLPSRDPATSTFSFYLATGKAYLSFYKTGLKNIYLNTRLVWSLNAATGIPRAGSATAAAVTPSSDTIATPPTTRASGSTTRSTFLLRRRWWYDVRRLPSFALLLLVCGEFTPLVVMAMPSLVPYTCRIPRQITALQRKAEARRAASFEKLQHLHETRQQAATTATSPTTNNKPTSLTDAEAAAHIARSLNLISPLWDRLPVPDASLARLLSTHRKVQRYVAFLREDDALLRQAGGVDALEREEVVLACADRAMGTLGRSEEELRGRLRVWLRVWLRDSAERSGDDGDDDTAAKVDRFLTERLLSKDE